MVGQSFFLHDLANYIDLGGGVLGCRGFFSSFRSLQGGLFLNHGNSVCLSISLAFVFSILSFFSFFVLQTFL